jgi:hypothetical protein
MTNEMHTPPIRLWRTARACPERRYHELPLRADTTTLGELLKMPDATSARKL